MTDWISLARLDGVAQAALCLKREVSPQELREAALRRMDALNPLLRAVVTFARDSELPAPKGPFAGVPFLVKDASPWPGLRWSMGSRLFANNIAPAHTPYSARLHEAGLVCVGKSSTSEFGLLGSTETLAEGVTHNPWNLAFSAGGSSGGSAAAVAAGLVPLAHANDGGGSIRIPAAIHGLFGFKPSRGRTLPAAFASSSFLDLTSDHCISRSVRDSALFLSITEDRTNSDPVGYVQRPISRKLRVAAYVRTAMGELPEPEVQRAFDQSVALVSQLGHNVSLVEGPVWEGESLGEAFFNVAGAAIADVVDTVDSMRGTPVQESELEPFTWALVRAARAAGPAGREASQRAFAKAVRQYKEMASSFDVVMTPTIATRTWQLGHLSPLLARDELIARTARSVGYTPLQNIVGSPAMSVPLAFPDDGLPIGTHFAAAHGQDALLLGLAYQLEQAQPWCDHWAPMSIPRMG